MPVEIFADISSDISPAGFRVGVHAMRELALMVDGTIRREISRSIQTTAKLMNNNDLIAFAEILSEWSAGSGRWFVRMDAIKALGEVITRLEPENRVPFARALEMRIRESDGLSDLQTMVSQGDDDRVRTRAMATLINIYSSLTYFHGDEIPEVVEILNSRGATIEEKSEAVSKLAHIYIPKISYGAVRLLILVGERLLSGNDSLVLFASEDAESSSSWRDNMSLPLGDRLQALAEHFAAQDGLLPLSSNIRAGKLRAVGFSVHERPGYPVSTEILTDEGNPVLLWPVRSPDQLAKTVWELLLNKNDSTSPAFKLSISIGAKLGEDLKPAALAVHAFAPMPYEFPEKIYSSAGVRGIAPVVEGGVSGPMGHIEMNWEGNLLREKVLIGVTIISS